MPQKVVGVGLIGCGNIGQIHAASMAHIAEDGVLIRPVIAADLSEDNRAEVRSNWHFEQMAADPQEVIAHPEVDAVFVCTPTFTHRDLVFSILKARKHLYSEKPLAPSFETVKEICKAVASSPVISQVGFQMRRNAMHARVKGFVESKEIGAPISYMIRNDECWPTTEFSSFTSTWRSQRKFSGGGPLIEHSIHAIDLASWMFGPPKRVSALTRSVFGFDVEDVAAVAIEHESGVIGTLMTIYGGVAGREESRFETFFEKGTVEVTWGVLVESGDDSFRITRSGEETVSIAPGRLLDEHLARLGVRLRPFFWNELASRGFFESVRTGIPGSPGFGDALIAHATIEAAYRSAREKRMVEIKELI